MKALLFVGLGGFCGAICRYLISLGVVRMVATPLVPYGTLAANVLGCLLARMLAGILNRDSLLGLFLIIGFLGSMTTFSTFSTETLSLVKTRSMWVPAAYAAGTVFACLLAAGLGATLIKNMKGA